MVSVASAGDKDAAYKISTADAKSGTISQKKGDCAHRQDL